MLLGQSGRSTAARMLSINLAFGRALRRARKARHITQQDLAAFARLDRTFISMLERGENSPSLVTMGALCRGLDISLTELAAEIERELAEARQRKDT
ncbi:helix-turn-helix domain-containing protein [Paraburkholderia sp. BR10872]|uniref:helix-turn-helix domain-containing protein n=1 Tax=Paraburkholderia sp. BR10872 TaxID=3236989 RepID=UPI0034D1DE76